MSQPLLNADGSSTTTWSDGTTRVDYPDGSAMTIYPDGRVLNEYPDGTRTFNDQFGNPLDPDTGQPLGGDPGPLIDDGTSAEEVVTEVLHGAHKLSSLAEAVGILGRVEIVEVVAEPLDGVLAVAVMAFEVWKALESANRAYACAGHCYGLMYGALDMDGPNYPSGDFSLDSAETIATKQARFADGVIQARSDLANGADGVLLRNKILLRTANLNSDPNAMIDELWQTSSRKVDNDFYADHMRLMWPDTGITER